MLQNSHQSARKAVAAIAATILAAAILVALPATAQAAEARTVETVADLQAAVSGATEDVTITLGEDFPTSNPGQINLTSGTGFNVVVDGGGKTLTSPPIGGSTFKITVSGSGSFTLQDLAFKGGATGRAGAIALSQNGTANVSFFRVDFVDHRYTAFFVDGAGTGDLVIDDSSFVGNENDSAAAMEFKRATGDGTARTTVRRSTFENNVGTSGGGYSGGAVRADPWSDGVLTFEDTAFIGNEFREGGTQPRGGAIAMHQSKVHLHLVRDYFFQNSTQTLAAGNKPNADGGAVSSFNTDANTWGSIFVSDSTFEENRSEDDGAAIFIQGYAPGSSPSSSYATKLMIENSTFINNVAGNADGLDSGGAIQASGRVEVGVQHSTFVGNTKDNNGGGVDMGYHPIINTAGGFWISEPIWAVSNSIFTKNKSLDRALPSCLTSVGCTPDNKAIPTADENQLLQDVFGTLTPKAEANGTNVLAGSPRGETYPVSTVRIAPKLTGTQKYTAYAFGSTPSTLTKDERGIDFTSTPDAGSLETDFVRFDAQTNGGSWAGLTPTFPDSGTSYFADATASTGWFEVGDPGQTVSLPTEPTAPAETIFVGWFTEAEGGTQVTAPVNTGQTLYAQFGAPPVSTFTVQFDSKGGSAVPSATVVAGDTVAQPVQPTRSGYDFKGWVLDGNPYNFSAPVTADLTLVATWAAKPVIEQPVPKISPDSLSKGQVGKSYAATITATGVGKPVLSLSGGKLPDGLKFDAKTGKITGTPTKVGTFKFTIKADDDGRTATKEYTIVIEKAVVGPCMEPRKIPVFSDTPLAHKFYIEIDWMECMKYATGWRMPTGKPEYRPQLNIERQAMAAFIFRMDGDRKNYKAPKTSPFADVKTTDKFYREIAWMWEKGYATGWAEPTGKPTFRSIEPLSREAMAAFIYRLEAAKHDSAKNYKAPNVSPMADMKKGMKFYKEISWMYAEGLTTGNKTKTGKEYWPKDQLSRQAMAAFIYRLVTDYRVNN